MKSNPKFKIQNPLIELPNALCPISYAPCPMPLTQFPIPHYVPQNPTPAPFSQLSRPRSRIYCG
ncbi:MAG: hypothetical protein ACRAVC_13145 [Trichormus sp.]